MGFVLDIISYVGMTISILVTLYIIFVAIWGERIRHMRNRRNRRNRSNRISPEMFNVLATLIQERNAEMVRRKEIELTEIRNKYKHTVIVVNPDEKIQIGTI